MNSLVQQPLRCPSCGLAIEETDNFCRRCGRSLKPGSGFIYTHTGIIVLALVLGPFALPVVWMSKRISLLAKWVYTAVLLLIGVWFIHICWQVYQVMQEATGVLLGGSLNF